jgi:hypothetical protein
MHEAESLSRNWYENADKMVVAFSTINPHYMRDDLTEMLYTHLELTTQEAAMRLAKKYPLDVGMFDKIEAEAMQMADYFSAGIMLAFNI